MEPIAILLRPDADSDLELRPGQELVARVARAPDARGLGLLALAGAFVTARLPAGARVGATLHLRVDAVRGEEVVFRLARTRTRPSDSALDRYA